MSFAVSLSRRARSFRIQDINFYPSRDKKAMPNSVFRQSAQTTAMTSPMKVTPTGAMNSRLRLRQSRHWPADETRARAAVGKQTLGSLVNGLRLLRRPAPTGRKRGAVGAANKGVVVEIPDCCLPSGGRVKQEVRLPIAVEISRAN
jgi:hypothetical protein